MTLDLKAHLSQLCDTPGPSGYEGPVREVIAAAWADLADQLDTDTSGNLLATKQATSASGTPRKILLTAHMDEIGLMVTRLEGSFLRVTSIGGIDRRILPGQLVTVHAARDLPGLIGSRPPHVTPPLRAQEVPAHRKTGHRYWPLRAPTFAACQRRRRSILRAIVNYITRQTPLS